MRCFLAALIGLAAVAVVANGQSTMASASAGVGSSTSSSVSPTSSPPGLKHHDQRYRLRKGDSFEVDFAYSPEFNQSVVVQPDGYVALKQIDSLSVEGKTIPELTDLLKSTYAGILKDPVISVSLKDFEMPYFIAGGQVGRPGKYDLRSDLTVTEAVAIAGGFSEKAKHSQVVLFHPENGGYKATLLNIKAMLASRDLAEDAHLQSGDMLYVPQNALSKIKPFLPAPSIGGAALF